jgi:hypothetical protein
VATARVTLKLRSGTYLYFTLRLMCFNSLTNLELINSTPSVEIKAHG